MPVHRSLIIAGLLVACASPPPARPTSAAPTPIPAHAAPTASGVDASSPTAPEKPSLEFIADDMPLATRQAKRAGKILFVDAWAPWCHTCLAAKAYVLNDPQLVPYAERVVFAEVDTDRPANAGFVERYAVDMWPTYFAIDPETGALLGYWPGAASARELRAFLDDALGAYDARRADRLDPDSPLALLLEAKTAQADFRYEKAAELYRGAVEAAPESWARRSEALRGLIASLAHAKAFLDCANVGLRYLDDVRGAALPTDFTRTFFRCTRAMKRGAERQRAQERAIQRLRYLADHPDEGTSVDDKADTLDVLADALAAVGDDEGARAAQKRRLELMEKAATRAPTPLAAATYDYGRANAYVALGRASEAIAMLREREKQLPSSYEPPARLAAVLAEVGKHAEALAAVDRALEHAYGPRKLRYLALKARIQAALGDRRGQIQTLQAEVAGYEALAAGHDDPAGLKDARRRLDAAKRGAR